ncbi:DUF4123 domain-containing protein [Vreelandella sp. GE22]
MDSALPTCTHLILDTAQPELREQWYRRSAYSSEAELLYVDTPFGHLTEVSPIVAPTSAADPFLQWVSTRRPHLRWGILLESKESSHALVRHFRHWLTIYNDHGDEVLWRFYDPEVLPFFLDAFSDQERQEWFGPCTAVHCRTPKETLRREPEKAHDVSLPSLPDAPWWRITQQHITLLRPLMRKELISDARQRLLLAAWSWLMHLDSPAIDARLEEAIDRLTALNQGELPSIEMAEHFCLLVFTSCSHLEKREDFQRAVDTHGIAKALIQWQACAYGQLPDRTHHDVQWLPDGPQMLTLSAREGTTP